jgi:hypothetical protein
MYKENGLSDLVPLVGADNLGIHSRQVVIDVVLLLVEVSLLRVRCCL